MSKGQREPKKAANYEDPLECYITEYGFDLEDVIMSMNRVVEIEGPGDDDVADQVKLLHESTEIKEYGYSWKIICRIDATGDYIGVAIRNMSGKAAKASYNINVKNQRKRDEDIDWKDPDGMVQFAADGPDSQWGCEDLLDREALMPVYGYCIDDRVKFRVTINLFSTVEIDDQPLATEILKKGPAVSEDDLMQIADQDNRKVIAPLVGVRAGHVQKLQDQLLREKFA